MNITKKEKLFFCEFSKDHAFTLNEIIESNKGNDDLTPRIIQILELLEPYESYQSENGWNVQRV